MAKTRTTVINWPLFCQMFAATRKRRGHSQEYISLQTNISESTISRIEGGAYQSDYDNFVLLCGYLGVPPENFAVEQPPLPVTGKYRGIDGALQAIMADKRLSRDTAYRLAEFLQQAYDLCATLPGGVR